MTLDDLAFRVHHTLAGESPVADDSALTVNYGVVFCSGFGVLNLGRAPDGCFHEVSMAGEHRQTSLVIDPPAEGGPSVLGGRVP